ncbi:1-acylglycerol-3-phosphate O-acyltransferase [Luteimonas sp. WGS1318]|uniref:1-acylglycerol-3-phosphate O-acyltransferase n=1 Tax=Luteimonas sp. WGS1318 TaxID=3366815 RepID=UPI00372D235B
MEYRQTRVEAAAPVITELPKRVLNVLEFAFTLLWTAGWISVSLVLQLVSGRRDRALDMARTRWAPGLVGPAGGLTVEGADAIDWSRPYLVVANHESLLDICVLFMAVPVPLRFLLKEEMRRVPFVAGYARATGMLFISRDDRRAGPQLRRQVAGVLGAGQSLCLFPEGTRTRDGRLGEFKSGSFQAAIDAGVEVLPIALHGTGAVLPARGFFRVCRGPMRATVGQPLPVAGRVGAAGRQALSREAQDAVAAMLGRSVRP